MSDSHALFLRITPKISGSLKGHVFAQAKKSDALNCPLDFFVRQADGRIATIIDLNCINLIRFLYSKFIKGLE